MEEKLSGIVLGGISYGENDKILKIFTLEKGVVSARIKGVKKAGAKLKFASEPFCFAEYIFSVRGDMRTVIGASLIDSFYPLREDIIKYFAGGTVLEFVKRFYVENIVSKTSFLQTVDTLKKLAYGDSDAVYELASYLILMLKESGFSLNISENCYCGKEIEGRTFFDYNSGTFTCEECFDGTGREINNSTLKALIKITKGNSVDKENVIRVLKLLEFYIENRTEESLSSLKELIKIL